MKNLHFKILILILCLPSGGILLLKAFGFTQMYASVYSLFIPSILLLFLITSITYKSHRELFHLVIIGAFGGLIGTFGYDLIRVPFILMGSRIFAPINMYGVWITDASSGSHFSDTIGWLYHFSNGITFGIMYALFMKNKSFWWAIAYALLLETIFVISPFGELFGLRSKPLSLVAAYLGHVAYGYPLGKMVQNYTKTIESLKFFKKGLMLSAGAISLIVIMMLFQFHSETKETEVIFTSQGLKPHIIRVNHGESIKLKSQMNSVITVLINGEALSLQPKQEILKKIDQPGIFQVKIKEHQAINSIFILNEPVENFNQTP
ncbi:hypothetical protein Q4Q34_16980 [Flavivirga abyssicola]|uniref:hypothetical protein n=1 Tax=Flavivirga abyssicola TaxID=3063533 RepID=UPI0026DF1404|nr:hypothetical protein [Flavivirga sp. MEBiC07777]WVK12910.1 hypothetical protein Q4Q34_16980 [Flavivirga sp. MEBiC07777]